jgi:predicted helicase
VTDIFSASKNGIQTGQDNFVVDFELDHLRDRLDRFFDPRITDNEIKDLYQLKDKAGWSLSMERATAFSEGIDSNLFVRYFYRPFDLRWIYYSKRVIKRPVHEVMNHLLEDNRALVTCRQQVQAGFRHIFVTDHIGDGNAISLKSREWNYYFPLYLYTTPKDTAGTLFATQEPTREPNLSPQFIAVVKDKLDLAFTDD